VSQARVKGVAEEVPPVLFVVVRFPRDEGDRALDREEFAQPEDFHDEQQLAPKALCAEVRARRHVSQLQGQGV